MEINIGEYVRTKEGIIGKIEQIGNSLYWLEDGSAFNIQENSDKHSPNIIDLIEVGDYVNELYIQEIISLKDNVMKCMVDSDYECLTTITNAEIKNVVTKEQFKNVMYEI